MTNLSANNKGNLGQQIYCKFYLSRKKMNSGPDSPNSSNYLKKTRYPSTF